MRFPKKNSPKKGYHLKHAVLKALIVMMISLAIGILGYHYTEKLEWIDSLLNASMILGGMGPVNEMHSITGKLFASFYALYSCFVALGIITIMMAPAMHNALRRFHLDPDNKYPPS
jgi:hypothetical protein